MTSGRVFGIPFCCQSVVDNLDCFVLLFCFNFVLSLVLRNFFSFFFLFLFSAGEKRKNCPADAPLLQVSMSDASDAVRIKMKSLRSHVRPP